MPDRFPNVAAIGGRGDLSGKAGLIAPQASRPALTGPPRLAVEGPRFVGTVRRYRPGRGVGRIRVPEGPDVFFHSNEVVAGSLTRVAPGVRVTFRRGSDGRGRRTARAIRVVPDSD